MTEAQLLLELLVRLLAAPTRFHAGHQPTLWRRWRQIAQVVFALAARAPLADQPDFLSRQVTAGPGGWPIGHSDAQHGEALGELALGALSPAQATPRRLGQRRLHRLRRLARLGSLARPPSACPRPAQPDVGGVDFLSTGNTHGPDQATRIERVTE